MPERSAVAAPFQAPLLRLEDVRVGYSSTVLHVPRLAVEANEVVALVGHSGCGKTTLLASISGAMAVLSGRILVGGEERDLRWRMVHTARTLQSFPLFHWLTVRQNLELACRIRHADGNDLDAILEAFSAGALADRYPHELSGGERCRASLAQAAVTHPKILLLDEPFTGLDTLVKYDVANALFKFACAARAAVLFVTHDLHDACHFATRVVVLAGREPTQVRAEIDPRKPDAVEHIRSLLSGQR